MRTVKPLNDFWRFTKLPAGMNISKDNVISPEYEDASWQPVVLPHTYNSEDGAGRMAAADGGDYYRGTVCYRRNLALSFEECSGKELYLEFEGANTVAEVYINGRFAGEHSGGYSAFRFDITDYIYPDKDNLIAVIVSNAPTDYIAPITDNGDFTKMGGLYRGVKLIAVEPVHIALKDSGSCGVSIDSYPPLDVFINLKQQQFAVELNTKILSASTIVTTIKNLMNSLVKDFNIFFNTIESKKEFWELVSGKESIQEISFDMVVPNFFGATGAAKELVSGAKLSLNADSVELSIKNKKGGLKATLDAIDSYVKYSSASGSWKLKIKSDGEARYRTVSSTDCCLKKQIESDILDLVKKMDNNWQVDNAVYNGLLDKLNGLFDYEE